MKFATVCSGIGAPEIGWIPLDWKPQFFSEIEPFPSAVLKHHYPNVPNLGDMTKFKEWEDYDLDVICGGCPCTSFSVAGLRRGLNDPRGNLTLTYLAIIDKYKPRYIVYENVPGILSDKTKALYAFLDGLEELGYVCDIDILDAQYFGVPQRRRRVFVVGQHIDDLLSSNTTSSAQTIAQMLMELAVLNFAGREYGKVEGDTVHVSEGADIRDMINRRLKLFKLNAEPNREMPGRRIIETLSKYETHCDAAFEDLIPECAFAMSEESVINYICAFKGQAWEDLVLFLREMSDSCPNKPEEGSITDKKAFAIAKTFLHIAAFVSATDKQVPTYASAATMAINGLMEFTNHARQANCNILADMEWIQAWNNFIVQAERVYKAFGYFGDITSRSEILSFAQSLSGYTPKSGEEGEDVTEDVGSSLDSSCAARKPNTTRGRIGRRVGSPWDNPENPHPTLYSGTKNSGGIGYSNQEIFGGGAYLVPGNNDIAGTLTANYYKHIESCVPNGHLHPVPIAFAQNQREEVRDLKDVSGVVLSEPGMHNQTFIAQPTLFKNLDRNSYGEANGSAGTLRVCCTEANIVVQYKEIANCITARDSKGCGLDMSSANLIIEQTTVQNTGQGYWKEGDIASTLRTVAENQRENLVVFPINTHNNQRDPEKFDAINRQGMGIGKDGDPAPTLSCGHVSAVAIQTAHTKSNGCGISEDTAHTLEATSSPQAVAHGSIDVYNLTQEKTDIANTVTAATGICNATGPKVMDAVGAAHIRRLTERECEFLQGFPADFTKIPYKGKAAEECPSGPRYKALGNSMATPCLKFIGERIMELEKKAWI